MSKSSLRLLSYTHFALLQMCTKNQYASYPLFACAQIYVCACVMDITHEKSLYLIVLFLFHDVQVGGKFDSIVLLHGVVALMMRTLSHTSSS